MPNTKSAERRVRLGARRHSQNQTVSSRLKTLEKRYEDFVKAGKRDDARQALSTVTSALDKAAKVGVIHKAKASRKKSRLAAHLATIKA